jgi:flagellar hook-associated protein 3 FlgL
VSTGASTTGSYFRDLLRSLATIGSLDSTQIGAQGFGDLVQDTRTCLTGAVNAMAGDDGVLGETQSRLNTIKTHLGETATALTGQVANTQDVDMAATLSSLTQVQTQLQASYQLIATMSARSLVKYLPGG